MSRRVEALFDQGGSIIEVSRLMGISRNTFYAWLNGTDTLKKPFREVVSIGKEAAEAWWMRQGRENIENNNFFNMFLMPHFKYKTEIEKIFKNKNEVNYTYISSYPLNINYTEQEIAAYEKDVNFYEFMILLYFISLIIFLISLYIPRGYYDFELIKQERDKFILNEANKNELLFYRDYINKKLNNINQKVATMLHSSKSYSGYLKKVQDRKMDPFEAADKISNSIIK